MEKLPPIYNSRLLKLYVTYLEKHYPNADLAHIVNESQISKLEIDDPGHWFNQAQVDRFHEKILEATNNPSIAREVGRFSISTNAAGAVKQRVLGLLNVASIYLLLAKLYPLLSRGASVEAIRIKANKVQIIVTHEPGVQEKPHQCENRKGIFEALAKLFTDRFADIEHDQCIHRGDSRCIYMVSWQEPAHRKWRRGLLLGLGLTLVAAVIGAVLLPMAHWLTGVTIALIGLLALSLRGSQIEKRELINTIQGQGNVAEEHIKEIDYRYRGVLLVQKIGQATSEILDIHQLTKVVVENLQNYLDFDRGIIMLADEKRNRLEYMAGYGFDEAKTELLQKAKFRLDNPEAKGVFIQVFKEQRPLLVEDIHSWNGTFSERSRNLIEQIGSRSLICLPIVYESQSIGILAVDNIQGKRPLTQSDMNLLMGVACQTAVSIYSVMARKKIQDSQERYRDLYDNAPTAYFSMRVDQGDITNCNVAATRLLGYSRSELIGSSWVEHFCNDQGNRDRVQGIQQTLCAGQSIHNEEVKLICKNGNSLWANLSMEPFRDSQGQVREGRCVLIDTTERKRLEEKLRHAQKMEAMGTLAGGVAHDLSNILSAIVSYPDLLLMDIGNKSHLFEPLNKIKAAGMRAAAIVQDLLTLARLGVQITEVLDINAIVQEFVRSPEYDNIKSNHPKAKVTVEVEHTLPGVRGSSVHLMKMLMNIVNNAAEAMPDGGEIRIRTWDHILKQADPHKHRDPGRYVALSVMDNGTGIAKEDLERIFEPFFTKKVMGRSGTGLGMAIVWATVQDHKGYIDVESEVGQGTTVTLLLPATNEVRVKPAATPLIQDLLGRGETILIIDDEAEHRTIATQMLVRLGYQVVAVDSAKEALAHVQQEPPDLLILDMVLGTDIDGLAVYRRILALRPDQKAVITSGFSETARVRQALELGAGFFIAKPYGMKEIAMAVRQVLDKG